MLWTVDFTAEAEKQLLCLDKPTRERIQRGKDRHYEQVAADKYPSLVQTAELSCEGLLSVYNYIHRTLEGRSGSGEQGYSL